VKWQSGNLRETRSNGKKVQLVDLSNPAKVVIKACSAPAPKKGRGGNS